MARSRIRKDRNATDIADVILAEWYKILQIGNLPAGNTDAQKEARWDEVLKRVDLTSLSVAFTNILEDNIVEAVLDGVGTANKPLKIVVPMPPANTLPKLDEYVQNNTDFRVGMSAAILFGCGR